MLRNTLAQLLENQRMYPTQNMLNANNQELLLRNELAQCIKYRKKLIDDQPKAGGTLPCIDPFQELFAEISVHQIQKDPNHNLLNVINRELLLRNRLAQLLENQRMYPAQNMLNVKNQELLLRNELAQCIKYRKKLIDDQPKAG
eukprot:70517_1